ncbi:MAG: DUF4093 domain-containing protein [Oscillospiraceae bacterium]|jgi:ribonuclease M5|nr:DUF4093 domain-containing protein [Oscillospiraceae bacterium]
MTEKLKVREAVVVEGKYDKIKLSALIDGLIIETHGFRIFRDKEQLELLRRLADKRGLLILTDSDSAGFMIRNFLKGSINPEKIKNAYIPDIFGKEKRKAAPGKEGKLGVEGIPINILRECLLKAGVSSEPAAEQQGRRITKTDLFELGLSGGAESMKHRRMVQENLNLPEHLSANGLVEVLNSLISRESFCSLCHHIFGESTEK